jgi:hypothetical protein
MVLPGPEKTPSKRVAPHAEQLKDDDTEAEVIVIGCSSNASVAGPCLHFRRCMVSVYADLENRVRLSFET